MIRIVIAEDQGLILGALARLIGLETDLLVLATALNGTEALEKTRELRPDLLISDIEMPGASGLDVAETLARESSPSKVLIVTTFQRPGYLRRARAAGVRGYLLKDTPAGEFVAAIRQVAAGRKVFSPDLLIEAAEDDDPLTQREREALRLAEQGLNAREIGARMGLTHGVARNYLSEASQKLGANNRILAARIARMKGWL